MEGHVGERRAELSFPNTSKSIGTLALKKFTIPRKKRAAGKAPLEACPEESRDYSLIQSILSESRLDMGKELSMAWQWKDVKLVHNDELLREFSEKRSEMRSKGRHVREMEERFCFLVTSYQATAHIYQHGLKVENTDQHSLGKPSHGVYLFKHADVALKNAGSNTLAGKNLIIFKVLFGKVKKVTPSVAGNSTQDPVVNFDCHISKDAAGPKDTLSQQVLGSSVFLFDYNENQDLNARPRQCLPYAVVSIVPINNATPPTSTSIPVSPTKLPSVGLMHGTCTIAERRGKGESATVTFKHFATQGHPLPEYRSQGFEIATPLQRVDQPNKDPCTPQQQWILPFHSLGPFMGSVPFTEHSAPFGSPLVQNTLFSSQQVHNTTSTSENVPNTTVVLDKVSTIVYSSRVVRDPRLSGRETSNLKRESSQEHQTEGSASVDGLMDEQKCQSSLQYQEKECKKSASSGIKTAVERISKKTEHDQASKKNQMGTLPSARLFKMKLKKYAAYLQLNEKERRDKIWSIENMPLDEKKLLFERVHFYENHYQRYKNGLLNPKETETETVLGRSCKAPSEDKACLSKANMGDQLNSQKSEDICTENHQEMRQPDLPYATNLAHLDHRLNIVDKDKENNEIEHYSPELKKEQEPEGESLDQSSRMLRISEKSTKQSPLQFTTQEVKPEAMEISSDWTEPVSVVFPPAQSLINDPALNHSECSDWPFNGGQTVEKESIAGNEIWKGNTSGSELSFIQGSDTEFMDVASCEEVCTIQISEDSEINPGVSPVTTLSQGRDGNLQQHSQSNGSAKCEERETLTHFTCDGDTENFRKLQMEDLQPKDMIYSMLYNRLQFHQLLPISSVASSISDKPYLKPSVVDRTLVTNNPLCPFQNLNQPNQTHDYSDAERPKHWDQGEQLSLRITVKADRGPASLTESHSLSKRFLCSEFLMEKPPSSFSPREAKFTHSSTMVPTKDKQCDLEASISNNVEGQGRGQCNARLIKLLALKYTEKESLTSRRCCKQKLKKVSVVKKTIAHISHPRMHCQSTRHTLKRVRNFKRRHLKRVKRDFKMKRKRQFGEAVVSRATLVSPNCHSVIIETDNEGISRRLDQVPEAQVLSECVSPNCVPKSEGKRHSMENNQESDIYGISDQDKTSLNTDSSNNEPISDQDQSCPNTCASKNDMSKDGGSTSIEHQEEDNIQEKASHADTYSPKTLEETQSDHAKTPTEDSILANENMDYLAEPASEIQCDSVIRNTISSSTTKPQVEVTLDSPCIVNKGEMETENVMALEENHHSFLQEQGSIEGTDRLIIKLRNYLTRFESTVKKQEPLSETEKCLPLNWVTLDSRIHKQQLYGLQFQNRLEFLNLRPQESSAVFSAEENPPGHVLTSTISQEDTGKACIQSAKANSPSDTSKQKMNRNNQLSKSRVSKKNEKQITVSEVSPANTSMLETVTEKSNQHPMIPFNKANGEIGHLEISTNTLDTGLHHTMPNLNDGNGLQQSAIICNQSTSSINMFRGQHRQLSQAAGETMENATQQSLLNEKLNPAHFQKEYSVIDISNTLKESDNATTLAELSQVQSKCKYMLRYFISNFERDQNVAFNEAVVSRNHILERYLYHPPAPVDLKYEALNSFLEMQMMMEAWQFVGNKIKYLSGQRTFRSLLWYDPTLYGELYKGEKGFQQQSSLFSSFQQCLANEGYCKLQEYNFAVSTLYQQLIGDPDTSYYMYLKSKREKLETEIVLQNHSDIQSFFLSVPVSSMINFGDCLVSLEKLQNRVMSFVETPSGHLSGTFDVGKAEHLSIMCRYLQEKISYLKAGKGTGSKVSWFGLEHLFYDASKILVWRDTKQGVSHEVLLKYKNNIPQIVYGVTESGIQLVNIPSQIIQPIKGAGIPTLQREEAMRKHRGQQLEGTTERKSCARIKRTGNGPVETSCLPTKRRLSNPLQAHNMGNEDVPHCAQPQQNQAGPFQPTPHNDCPKSHAIIWNKRLYDTHAADWNASPFLLPPTQPHPEIRASILSKQGLTMPYAQIESSAVTEREGSNTARQQQWNPRLNSKKLECDPLLHPRTDERAKDQPIISVPQLPEFSKQQALFSFPSLQPYPQPTSLSTTTAAPPPLYSPHPLSSTTNNFPLHHEPTPINYPFFIWNGCTYSTGDPSISTEAPHAEARFHPRPI